MEIDILKRKFKSSEQQEMEDQMRKDPLLSELKHIHTRSNFSDVQNKTRSEII